MNKLIKDIKDTLEENHSRTHNYEMWDTEQHEEMRESFEYASLYVDRLEAKIQLLKELILLTHKQVSHIEIGDTQLRQLAEYIAQFPEEE